MAADPDKISNDVVYRVKGVLYEESCLPTARFGLSKPGTAGRFVKIDDSERMINLG